MSKLVICEKPSVAKSIASALGVTSRADGYFEGGGWLISWCIGHLVGLADAAAYDDRYKKWRYEDLPILPAPFHYVVSEEKAAQFHIGSKTIRAQKLCQRIKHTVMRSPEHHISIVWRVAFPIICIVPTAILRLRIKPVRDIQMRLLSRHIADKAEHQMDSLLPQ